MNEPIGRRDLLKRLGVMSAGVVIIPLRVVPSARAAVPQVAAAAPAVPEALATLTAVEAATLQAAVARIIPTDENGPGAREAGAARYIDRALAGYLAPQRAAYAAGLAALDAFARQSKGRAFAEVSEAEQDEILKALEADMAPGFGGGSAQFFRTLRQHTVEGTFCDPYHGGNANFVGWDLIGYPGIRTMVMPEHTRMGVTIAPTHRSAYAQTQFVKPE